MKICMVTSSYPKYTGDVAAPFIQSIATYVAAQGHEVAWLAVAIGNARARAFYEKSGFRIETVRYTKALP